MMQDYPVNDPVKARAKEIPGAIPLSRQPCESLGRGANRPAKSTESPLCRDHMRSRYQMRFDKPFIMKNFHGYCPEIPGDTH